MRGIHSNDLGVWSGLHILVKAITNHRANLENMLQALWCGSIVCTTKFDIDLECEVVAILVASAIQLASSNNLSDHSFFDISPLLDGSTELSRLRDDDQYKADGRSCWFRATIFFPGLVLLVQVRIQNP